ncbi:uncharacterized protein LOC141613813 [Silene latifolia]|uniref:uncharacterized protein LOC141613813 n=1 Tax=Silene latifolia TaxID=37657 RepID=UPI003D78591B
MDILFPNSEHAYGGTHGVGEEGGSSGGDTVEVNNEGDEFMDFYESDEVQEQEDSDLGGDDDTGYLQLYKRPSTSPKCMFKIDLQKAYDTVEWEFVENLLIMLNFPVGFRNMVLQCITTPSFSITMNGEIRGDAESMMLLLRSFSTFSKATGLKVGASKSNAYFCGVPDQLKQEILSVSGFSEGELPFRYLGMPIQTTRLQKRDCECLVEKICTRIHSFGARKFSYAGRLILVQAVLKTLCSYWASLFILPKSIVNKVETTCRNILWDGSADYRRAPLVAL